MSLLFAGLHCTSEVTQLETEFRNKVSFHPLAQCSLAGFRSQILLNVSMKSVKVMIQQDSEQEVP